MRTRRHLRRCAVLSVVIAALTIGVSGVPAGAQVRGFDGETIKVAGYGIKSQLPGVEFGARARFQQFNDDNELKGVKIDMTEFVNDNTDPATSLSEVRRLVTQEQVFALVPEASLTTPGDYIKQQKIPDFGGGFTGDACATKPSKDVWVFGFNGCQVTTEATKTPDTEANVLKYVQETSGKAKPTVSQISNDNAVGKVANELFRAQYEGNKGWGKLGYNEASVPDTGVGDVTPYVQALSTSIDGKAPDFIRCGANLVCIQLYDKLRAGGFTGEFEHNLYTDALVKPLSGTIVAIPHHNLAETGNAALEKLKTNLAKVKPDQKLDSGVAYGYMSADMFVSALKKAAAKGKSGITPENVQKAAATQTWEIKDFAGPTKFPASTVAATPMCREIVKSNGTTWDTVEPYSCNTKTYKVK